MLIQAYLQTIPNDLIVKQIDRDEIDPRTAFLITRYELLIEDGFNLPAINNTTTTGNLKENLTVFSLYHPREVQELLYDFADEHLHQENTLKEDYVERSVKEPRSLKTLIIIWVVIFMSVILVVVLLAGILSGNFSFTSAFSGILNILGLSINHAPN